MGMLFVLFGLVVAPFVVAIALYNRLVALRNRFRNAFAQVDVQLKRRYDLIPTLVETARGYLVHERATLEEVTLARNAAAAAIGEAAANPGSAGALRGLGAAEERLAGLLSRLLVTVEAYPDLKANTTMLQLMEDLASTENRVAFARQAFNDAVMLYNTARESFPSNLVAGAFRFEAAGFFALADASEREAPVVRLDAPR